MNKKWLGAGAALLLGGCASVEMAQYTVTSFAEVPLKKNATVKIVAGDKSMAPMAKALKRAFSKNQESGFSIAEDKADYWFVISGEGQYAKGVSKRKFVAKKENEAGGTDVIAAEPVNYASAAKGVSVAVYDAKTLTPVHYFEIPVFSGEKGKDAVRDEAAYDSRFTKEAFMRVKDAFLTQQKQVKTPVPLVADAGLRSLFAEGGAKYAKGDSKAYDNFLRRYEQLGRVDLAKLCEALRTKTYEGSDADVKLGNHYLYLLVMEVKAKDPDELARIKDEQLKILEASDAKGIAVAVPVALARLEYKLANLGR